jgi:hypothetical protein
MALLTLLGVARRIASLAGILVLIALALTLLWRVYLHHQQADPYDRDEPVTVELDIRGKICEAVELNYSRSKTSECGTTTAISDVRRKQIT